MPGVTSTASQHSLRAYQLAPTSSLAASNEHENTLEATVLIFLKMQMCILIYCSAHYFVSVKVNLDLSEWWPNLVWTLLLTFHFHCNLFISGESFFCFEMEEEELSFGVWK